MTSAVPSSSSRHRGRRAALTAVLAGALIAGGTVVATVAAPAGAAPSFQEEGTLTLKTRNGVTTATLGGSTQTFATSGQCQLTSTGPTLMRFSALVDGKAANVGFQGGTFGVAEKPSGASCAEVNNNRQAPETLIIKLGGSDVFPLVADSATLDIEAKGTGATATVAFFLGGVSQGTQTVNCNATVGSDSGPDAKSGDNCEETVGLTDGTFDEIRLTASSGAAVSLEGGQDWGSSNTPNVTTTFNVGYFAEPPVACTSGEVSVNGTGSLPTVTIRDISTSSGPDCQDFVYSLTNTGGKATFLKPYSEQSQRLQFMMDLEWQILDGATAELPKIFFGFHDVDLVEGTARELKWCANSTFELATGSGPTITTAMDVETNNVKFPGVQYACITDSSVERDVNGKPTAWFQSIYVHGDAFARR